MMKHPEFYQMVALAERLRLELDSSDRKNLVGSQIIPDKSFWRADAPHIAFTWGAFNFSAHFHSRNKPITPLPTLSNLSTSLHPIRIRPSRSNASVSNTNLY